MIKPSGTFSADVKLHFYVGERQIELGQLGPGFAILRSAQTIDACDGELQGELETVIDGKNSRWKIRITSPITTASKRFTFEAV